MADEKVRGLEFYAHPPEIDMYNSNKSWTKNKGINVSVMPKKIDMGVIDVSGQPSRYQRNPTEPGSYSREPFNPFISPNTSYIQTYPIVLTNHSSKQTLKIPRIIAIGHTGIVSVNGLFDEGNKGYEVKPRSSLTVVVGIRKFLQYTSSYEAVNINSGVFFETLDASGDEFVLISGTLTTTTHYPQ